MSLLEKTISAQERFHYKRESQHRAYGKAGNGNETEMETGNGNWKWKLETEMGTKNTPITGVMFPS